jgi:hypothetical protein
MNNNIDMRPKAAPFYNNRSLNKMPTNPTYGNFMWLFGSTK